MTAIPLGPIKSEQATSVVGDSADFHFVGGDGMWRLLGEVDIANRSEFAVALRAVTAGVAECVLDLRDLEFIGVGELRLIAEVTRDNRTHLRLVNAPALVRMCWDASGLGDASDFVTVR
jgi:anti-anti-sigma factor